MKKHYDRIGDYFKIEGRFTIPSGIITTTPSVMLKFAKESEALGIITSKSIGPKPRLGNKSPVVFQEDGYTLYNAIGLANPGAEAYAAEMETIREEWPKNKFLLTSIFAGDKNVGDVVYGDTKQDLVYVAKLTREVSSGLELNFGCPHSGGLAQIGRSPELVYELTAAVADVFDKPILVKLTPSAPDIAAVAKAAEEAGASGIVAINTVGPFDTPYLFTGRGSKSGSSIKSTGVTCVNNIAKAVDIPIIGMGGISSLDDVLEYEVAGADFFGIGSSLIGHSTYKVLDILRNANYKYNNKMDYSWNPCLFSKPKKLTIKEVKKLTDDLRIMTLDYKFDSPKPGQFMMLQPEGKGAKPFSIADNDPLTFVVRKVGDSTSKMFELEDGDELTVSGPYGVKLELEGLAGMEVYLVGGGTGVAPLNMIIKELNRLGIFPAAFIGAKKCKEVIFEDNIRSYCTNIFTSTDDGSGGNPGFVTELLESYLSKSEPKNVAFINCGPEVMIKRAIEVEQKYVKDPKIICLIERYTKCGLGICGSCATESGYRACVDGPAFELKDVVSSLGIIRDATGMRIVK